MSDSVSKSSLSQSSVPKQGAPKERVALVHDWLTGMRGGEKVLEAIAEVFPEAPIYTLVHIPGSVSEALENHPIHTSFVQRAPQVFKRYRSYLPFFPAAIEDLDLTDYDLIISTSHCVAKGVIPGPEAYHLCYCHTPMRYAWDQERAYFPSRRGPIARLRQLALAGLRLWDVASASRVDHFVANSSFVAQRIRRYYGRSAEVIHPPVEIDRFNPLEGDSNEMDSPPPAAQDEVPEFALMVSALAPYKRVDWAIEACRRAGLELRVVGDGPQRGHLEKLIRETPGESPIQLLGRVEGDELEHLYRDASFFLQPGIEDFGIASVEALASGTPVVALACGGILDIADDGAHGVLYPRSEPGQEIKDLAVAIDKARKIRFNPLDLQRRARSFSHDLFRQRLLSSLTRRSNAPEALNE